MKAKALTFLSAVALAATAGAATAEDIKIGYINKMGDYCGACRYDHRARTGDRACPFNMLYWHFLIIHEERLLANPRSGKAVLGLRHL
ncbi:MAG TPA: hypothetical protein PKA74_13710, partial [Bauldia sp.]|nr:hypothetical protein [Bauldia sp.]